MSPFETWLNSEMSRRGIRSARWLAQEAGLDATQVVDWMLGRSVPDDDGCARLARHWNVPEQTVRGFAVPIPKARR